MEEYLIERLKKMSFLHEGISVSGQPEQRQLRAPGMSATEIILFPLQ